MDTSFQATLRNLNKIIERESKSTTYKFALLRGTIDIIRLYWRTRNKEILNIMKGQIQIGNFKSQSPPKSGDGVLLLH